MRKLDPRNGRVLRQVGMAARYFGEGMVRVGDRLIQLTWREHRGFVYDAETFEVLREFPFTTHTGQGWGITWDGTHLVVSDGSPLLFFWDPATMTEVRRVTVLDRDDSPVRLLNELEFYRGHVLANVWYDDRVARIDPATGRVVRWYDLAPLRPREQRGDTEDVLNGIAVDKQRGELYVTGKLWPVMFRIRLRD